MMYIAPFHEYTLRAIPEDPTHPTTKFSASACFTRAIIAKI
jgi:hypothetical protein